MLGMGEVKGNVDGPGIDDVYLMHADSVLPQVY